MLTETAYAKINLALHVRRKRADGYHELETIFAFAEDGDVLVAELADNITLRIDGPFAEGLATDDSNLVIRAAKTLAAASGITGDGKMRGARLHLTKNLPIASGIGGGSADAAAALRVLMRLWQINLPGDQLASLALALGADVPACLSSQTMRGEGVGENLTPINNTLAGTPLLLVNPRVAVSTAAVFKAWDGEDRGPLGYGDDLLTLALSARNDLIAPALILAPVIGDVLAALVAQSGVLLTRMSGSGATCFALFESVAARDAAHVAIQSTHADCWTLASRIR